MQPLTVIGRRAEDEREIVPPNKEVMKELIGLASGNFKLLMTFAAATGVRAGELRALRWRNISFERREVRVEKRVDAYSDEDLPKTRAGKRTIPPRRKPCDRAQGMAAPDPVFGQR